MTVGACVNVGDDVGAEHSAMVDIKSTMATSCRHESQQSNGLPAADRYIKGSWHNSRGKMPVRRLSDKKRYFNCASAFILSDIDPVRVLASKWISIKLLREARLSGIVPESSLWSRAIV